MTATTKSVWIVLAAVSVLAALGIGAYMFRTSTVEPRVLQGSQQASAPETRVASAPRKEEDGCALTTRGPAIDDAYRQMAKQGSGLEGASETHDSLLKAVREQHRHYLYVGFLERYPDTPSRKEIECLARGFEALRPPTAVLLSLEELSNKYHYNGTMTMAYWSKASGPIAQVRGVGITGSPMIGNLQFIESPAGGGLRINCKGIEVPAGATLIYPLTKPKAADGKPGASSLYQECTPAQPRVAPATVPPRAAPSAPMPPQAAPRLQEGELCFGKEICAKGLVCENDLCVRASGTK